MVSCGERGRAYVRRPTAGGRQAPTATAGTLPGFHIQSADTIFCLEARSQTRAVNLTRSVMAASEKNQITFKQMSTIRSSSRIAVTDAAKLGSSSSNASLAFQSAEAVLPAANTRSTVTQAQSCAARLMTRRSRHGMGQRQRPIREDSVRQKVNEARNHSLTTYYFALLWQKPHMWWFAVSPSLYCMNGKRGSLSSLKISPNENTTTLSFRGSSGRKREGDAVLQHLHAKPSDRLA